MINTYKIKKDVYLTSLSLSLLSSHSVLFVLLLFFLLLVWPIAGGILPGHSLPASHTSPFIKTILKLPNYKKHCLSQIHRHTEHPTALQENVQNSLEFQPLVCFPHSSQTCLSLSSSRVCPRWHVLDSSELYSCGWCWTWRDAGERVFSWRHTSGMNLVRFSWHFLSLSHLGQQVTCQRQDSSGFGWFIFLSP